MGCDSFFSVGHGDRLLIGTKQPFRKIIVATL